MPKTRSSPAHGLQETLSTDEGIAMRSVQGSTLSHDQAGVRAAYNVLHEARVLPLSGRLGSHRRKGLICLCRTHCHEGCAPSGPGAPLACPVNVMRSFNSHDSTEIAQVIQRASHSRPLGQLMQTDYVLGGALWKRAYQEGLVHPPILVPDPPPRDQELSLESSSVAFWRAQVPREQRIHLL